jgi:hypothetical protein
VLQPASALEMSATAANPAVIQVQARSRFLCCVWLIQVPLRVGLLRRGVL